MSVKKEITLEDIRNTIDKYQHQEKEKKERPLNRNDLEEFIYQYNLRNQQVPQSVQVQHQVPQQVSQQSNIKTDERKQIAFQIYKDAKSTMIVCLIAMVFPMVALFTAIFSIMMGMVVACIAIIYPAFVFMKMLSIQKRAYMKYGFQPLIQLPQQNFNKRQGWNF